ILDDHGAQGDTGIEVAREIEIKDSTGVNATARFFQLFDDLHGADFRGPGNCARRETSHQRIKAIDIFAQRAAQTRNQMHDMGIALDRHQFFDTHAAIFAYAAEVVATEVYEHDVLGALFFVGEHFAFEALVFGFVFSAPTRARDWTIEDVSALYFD